MAVSGGSRRDGSVAQRPDRKGVGAMDGTSHLIDRPAADVVQEYLKLAQDGLERMYDANSAGFPETARLVSPSFPANSGDSVHRIPKPAGPQAISNREPQLALEGHSVRDTAIAALGIARLPMWDQQTVLLGAEAADLVAPVMARALAGTDPGAVALATWLAAECQAEVEAAR